MADRIILVDTSILIEYYRKTDKANSVWVNLVKQGYGFAISTITKYEIYSGATPDQLEFWDDILSLVEVIPFNELAVDTAVAINAELKRTRKQIDLADLFIAATSVANNYSLATLNRKRFNRIGTLNIIE